MAKFLTTVGNSYSIEQIIINSENFLTLVTPYLKLSKNLIERLKDANLRGVKITLIYGKNDLQESEKSNLQKLTNLQVYFYKNLHAKCYFNEREMIITSMNLYEFSERHNREMGISLEKRKDRIIYEDAIKEVKSIINTAVIDNYFSNDIKVDVIPDRKYKLNNLFLDPYNFHLPTLKTVLTEKYKHYSIRIKEKTCISLNNFPIDNIDMEIMGIIVFYFHNESFYNNVKENIKGTIKNQLPEMRIYWNYLKVQIYHKKGFKEEVSIDGLKVIVENFEKTIDVFHRELQSIK